MVTTLKSSMVLSVMIFETHSRYLNIGNLVVKALTFSFARFSDLKDVVLFA